MLGIRNEEVIWTYILLTPPNPAQIKHHPANYIFPLVLPTDKGTKNKQTKIFNMRVKLEFGIVSRWRKITITYSIFLFTMNIELLLDGYS